MPGATIAEQNADMLRGIMSKLDEVLRRQRLLEEQLSMLRPGADTTRELAEQQEHETGWFWAS